MPWQILLINTVKIQTCAQIWRGGGNLRSGSIFVSLGETFWREGRNEKQSLIQFFYRKSAAHFFDWLTFNKTGNQNLFCLHAPLYANFPYVYVMAFAKSPQMSAKIRKTEAMINLGTSVQIYNLKVRAPVLYIVALSELKLNENSEHDEVIMYQNMLLHVWILSHFRWYPEIFSTHLSPIFCVKYLGKLREIPSVSLFRKKISIKPFINKRVFCNLI